MITTQSAGTDPGLLPARTRIKVCGITRFEDAHAAVAAGADALGFVFHPASPRYIDPVKAGAIAGALPPFVTPVALLVDADPPTIEAVLRALPQALLQFHGDEAPAQCARWQRSYIKALRMRAGLGLDEALQRYAGASAILLDAYRPGLPGGTGTAFDWSAVPLPFPRPLVLAGGLCAENVGAAIARLRPYAVDVSSGVESAPGSKNAAKIAAFVASVRHADALYAHA